MSVLDPEFIEALCSAAKLSAKERDVMRLDCAEALTAEEVGARLGCSVGCVKTYRSRAKSKIRKAQATYEAEQRGRDQEEQDREDLAGSRAFYGFVLREAMSGPRRHNPAGPNIGRTWTDASGLTLSEEGRMNAGSKAVVTVGDLMGDADDIPSALNQRVQGSLR